eukprot:1969684-Amphidinium_carterae.1
MVKRCLRQNLHLPATYINRYWTNDRLTGGMDSKAPEERSGSHRFLAFSGSPKRTTSTACIMRLHANEVTCSWDLRTPEPSKPPISPT